MIPRMKIITQYIYILIEIKCSVIPVRENCVGSLFFFLYRLEYVNKYVRHDAI